MQNHYEQFTVGEGLLRTVNYSGMLSNAGLTNEQVSVALANELGSKSYLFDDAVGLLAMLETVKENYDIEILTFGQAEFQQLKISREPLLKNIPVNVTLEPKALFIAKTFAAQTNGVLVDDKPGQHLPANWLEIHIDRTATTYEKPQDIGEGIIRITSLDDVVGCI